MLPQPVVGGPPHPRHFDGSQPLAAAIEAAAEPDSEAADWFPLLSRVDLGPNAQHRVAIDCDRGVRLVRLRIFPDGGVARLRVYGEARPDWKELGDRIVDLVAAGNGGSGGAPGGADFGAPG